MKRSILQTPENTATEHWIYNLTGDTIDIGNDDVETDGEIEFGNDMEDFISIGKMWVDYGVKLMFDKKFCRRFHSSWTVIQLLVKTIPK